jgi:hypothetical protein
MVAAGGFMIATGVGGPIGMAMVSAGVDTVVQKWSTGRVNWTEVAISGAMGAASAGASGLILKAGLRTGAKVAAGMAANAAIGGVGNGAIYVDANHAHLSARGLVGAVAGGTIAGAAMGGSDAVGAVAARRLGSVPARLTMHVTAGSIEAAGGMVGSATDQLVSSGHVDERSTVVSGGVSLVAGRGSAYLKDQFGGVKRPYEPQHAVGPQHRAPTIMDYDYRAEGADAPLGIIAAGVLH